MTKEEYGGIRVEFVKDVQYGNRDALWTVPAGTRGTTCESQGKCLVKLDKKIEHRNYVYCSLTDLRKL